MSLIERGLEWEGCCNVRDLGGFATRDGGRTREGALVRADGLDRLTEAGWASLVAHGVRTVLDLRNDDELHGDLAARPEQVETIHVPIDDLEDKDLWQYIWSNDLDGSPLYFSLFLERKPHQCAATLRAIAHARPGGVVFHCGRGRDRTGLVAVLLLALTGVDPDDIAADYEMSTERVRRLESALGEKDQGSEIADILRRKKTSARALILELLTTVDIEERLRTGGLKPEDIAALQDRFVDSSATS